MLSNRLMTIAQKVPPSRKLVDVGTDHGFIPVFLVENGVCQKALATDISPASLHKAYTLARERGLEDKIETRVGSGLSIVEPGEVDTAIIAGMGGMLIRDILADSPQTAAAIKTFVLQPMVAQDVLRKWLVQNGFTLIDEVLAKEEDRIYEIIVACHGQQEEPKAVYYEIGKKLVENQDPLLEELVLKKIHKTQEIMDKLKEQKTPNAQKSYREFKQRLIRYKEVYQWDVMSKKS